MEERIQRTMKALERNKIKPYYVETREQLYDLVRELVKNDKLITAGGSMTLEESGVKELLMTEFKGDRKSTRLNSSHTDSSRMPSSA